MTIGLDPSFWRAVEARKRSSGAATVLKGVVQTVGTGPDAGKATVLVGEETYPMSPVIGTVVTAQVVYCIAYSQGKLLIFGTASGGGGTSVVGQMTQVQRVTDYSITNNTWTPIPYDAEVQDDGNWHSTATNTERVTPPAGLYLCLANMTWNSNTTGQRFIRIRQLNSAGTELALFSSPSITTTTGDQYGRGSTPSVPINISSGDYLTVEAWQNTTGALNFGIGTVSTLPTPTFSIVRLK